MFCVARSLSGMRAFPPRHPLYIKATLNQSRCLSCTNKRSKKSLETQGFKGGSGEKERDLVSTPIHSENGVTKASVSGRKRERKGVSEHKRKLQHTGKHMSQLGCQGSRKALCAAPPSTSSMAL